MSRAVETAEIINRERHIPISLSDDLKEIDFGVLSGTPYTDAVKKRHEAMDYDWRPSGENVDDVKTRVIRVLGQIASEFNDDNTLVVTHGGIIRMLHLLEDGEPFGQVDNASIHIFDLDKMLSNGSKLIQ